MAEPVVKRIQKISAVHKAIASLRGYIASSNLAYLPNEESLSSDLGISRLTVREAITVLESEGLVSRIQGKGTRINLFASKLKNRIDINGDIEGALLDRGYQASFRVVSVSERLPVEDEIQSLEIQSGESIIEVTKLLLADDVVVAVYIDRIPRRYLKKVDISQIDFEPSIYPTIEELTKMDITHDVVNLYPSAADEFLAKQFQIPVGTPLLKFNVIEYTFDACPLMLNTEYYTEHAVAFNLCRSVHYKRRQL